MTAAQTTTGHASEIFGSWDGYETIEYAGRAGWHIYSSWGEDGWDAGEWPLVILGARRVEGDTPQVNDVVETLYVVEGDVTIERFPSYEQAIRHLDGIVLWHWQYGSTGPADKDDYTLETMPDRFRGPFRWHRLCLKSGEPNCKNCRDAGKVSPHA